MILNVMARNNTNNYESIIMSKQTNLYKLKELSCLPQVTTPHPYRLPPPLHTSIWVSVPL